MDYDVIRCIVVLMRYSKVYLLVLNIISYTPCLDVCVVRLSSYV
jgi:hypothetical protein